MQNGFFSEEEMGSKSYLVLARKYRPKTFKDMIGQEVLITTLSNAIKTGRLAHAFVLTGIRGIGKTTSARIIARALNCIGTDGQGDVTIDPCGVCSNCVAIAEDRHQDVFELDAASNTGINDIREIIDNVRYKPINARYKVYIIDEVHMLSNSAFNALLKTLEEPPAHVKFIFATTEIRKIPVTVLSRCQRFDLRRITAIDMFNHLKNILSMENIEAEDDALTLVAKISGGSVRDALSILDQAIARSEKAKIETSIIIDMLGLVSSQKTFELFDNLSAGRLNVALEISKAMSTSGIDPVMVMQDMLDISHKIALKKSSSEELSGMTDAEKKQVAELCSRLSIQFISRLWQMLGKGLEEIKFASNPFQALDMVLIRIAYASSLPSLEDILKKIKASSSGSSNENSSPSSSAHSTSSAPKAINLSSFQDIITACYEADEMMLYHLLKTCVKFVSLQDKVLSINLLPTAPKNLIMTLQEFLARYTGEKWSILSSSQDQGSTVYQQEKHGDVQKIDEIKNSDEVQTMLKSFTGLEIFDIKLNKNKMS